MSISRCELCYELQGVSCYGLLPVQAGLTPNTEYTIFLKDKFQHNYTQTLTTDGVGDFVLDLSDFPEGMFTAFSGSYELTASTSEQESTAEDLTVNGTEYPCIMVSFVDLN